MHKIKEKIYDYFTTISIPGVPGIFTGNNILLKIIWTLLMLSLFGVGFWNIALSVNDYYNYDVTSNIKTETSESVVFPAITICYLGVFTQKIYNKTNDEFLFSKDYDESVSFEEFKSFLGGASYVSITQKTDVIMNMISFASDSTLTQIQNFNSWFPPIHR